MGNVVSKLSISKIVGKIDLSKLPADGSVLPVARIMGAAETYKTINTNFGESFEFKGQFEAIKLDTGEVIPNTRLFLPPTATDLLLGAMKDAKGAPISFAFDVGMRLVTKRDGTPGHEYDVTSLIEAKSSSAVDAVKALISGKPLPALPKPAAPALETAAPAPAEKAPEATAKAKK